MGVEAGVRGPEVVRSIILIMQAFKIVDPAEEQAMKDHEVQSFALVCFFCMM